MTFAVEEEVKVGEKRNVLVGIAFDGHTRELLDWALVKVADPGDCVTALHVCRNSGMVLNVGHMPANRIILNLEPDMHRICRFLLIKIDAVILVHYFRFNFKSSGVDGWLSR